MEKHAIAVIDLEIQPFTTFEPNGILLVCGPDIAHANPMTISWGMFGIMWGRPMAMVMVRHSRFTWDLIMQAPDFTINWMPDDWTDAIQLCGTQSGRSVDKFAATGLTPAPASRVTSPVIAQSSLSLECRTLYRSEVTPEQFLDAAASHVYPTGDFHTLFYGEIVAATGVEHFRRT